MKITRVISLLILSLVATLMFAAGEAKQYTLQDVPNVRLSDVRQYVSDPSHILSAPSRDSIYVTLTGKADRIDPVFRTLQVGDTVVPFEDLVEVSGEGIMEIDQYLGISEE